MDNSRLSRASVLVFGVFELDCRAGELRKSGVLVHLPPQPFNVLALLASHPGQVVTRDEIRQQIWGDEIYVDFEQGLNHCVRQIRAALGDGAEAPSYIETLPRRGYRFIYPVTAASPAAITPNQTAPPEQPDSAGTASADLPEGRALPYKGIVLAAVVSVLIVAGAVVLNVAGLRNHLLRHTTGPPIIHSIAVLPLENLSRDPQQRYFAEGMTEELITTLGKISALRVISRTSVMQYKDTKKPLPEIARELSVDAIVEGTVERSGDRVRITANLVYAPADSHLWADSYERAMRDVLSLQDEVARDIASQIRIRLTPKERTRLSSSRPVNPQALDLYLKGRYYWNKRTPEALKKSLECFQQAIERDPSYAPAYAGLADSYAMLAAGFYAVLPPREAYPKAEAAARKALQLDGTLAEAHATLAWSKVFFDWDWQEGEREFKRAIELNPGNANAHHWYAEFLTVMGRHGEAISEDRKAESLNPLSLIISADLAMEAFGPAGLYDQEMEQCRKTLEMNASFPLAHACLSDSYKHKRMYEEAVTEMRKAIDLSGGSVVWVSALAQIYALAGKRIEAMKILNELNARSRQEYVSPDLFAEIYASLGDNDQAFAWIEKGYEERSNLVGGLKAGRQLDPLRSDPRYQDLLRRMNFPK